MFLFTGMFCADTNTSLKKFLPNDFSRNRPNYKMAFRFRQFFFTIRFACCSVQHKFEKMVGCGQPIESNLHRHLTEHLNAEIVLRTITELDVAMQWLSSTFLYVRARKNPHHYGINVGYTQKQIDKKLLGS